jgi:hypothetical protein
LPTLEIPFVDRKFPVSLELSKLGEKTSLKLQGIIDTGATDTCVSFSTVQKLGISPETQFSRSGTASGQLFGRRYPVRVAIENSIFRLSRSLVLINPDPFMKYVGSWNEVPPAEILNFCQKNGVIAPEAILQSCIILPNNQNEVTVYRPGMGVEQPTVLIGMDILSQFDWHYSKQEQKLVIEY